jgi:hypothetical protein
MAIDVPLGNKPGVRTQQSNEIKPEEKTDS